MDFLLHFSMVIGSRIFIRFKKDSCAETYQKIVDIEPKYQYRWDTIKVGEIQGSQYTCWKTTKKRKLP